MRELAVVLTRLSEPDFCAAYGSEEQCRALLERLRWPDGFVCPACGHRGAIPLTTRPLLQCRGCRRQVSLTAGTIFHSTKLPLAKWIRALWLIATEGRISSIELGQRLGVGQTSAWAMRRRILACLAGRDWLEPLQRRTRATRTGRDRPGPPAGTVPLCLAWRVQ